MPGAAEVSVNQTSPVPGFAERSHSVAMTSRQAIRAFREQAMGLWQMLAAAVEFLTQGLGSGQASQNKPRPTCSE